MRREQNDNCNEKYCWNKKAAQKHECEDDWCFCWNSLSTESVLPNRVFELKRFSTTNFHKNKKEWKKKFTPRDVHSLSSFQMNCLYLLKSPSSVKHTSELNYDNGILVFRIYIFDSKSMRVYKWTKKLNTHLFCLILHRLPSEMFGTFLWDRK